MVLNATSSHAARGGVRRSVGYSCFERLAWLQRFHDFDKNLSAHVDNTDTMSTKTKEPSEGDVIVARALSSYAQLRANIAKWSGLPAGSVSTTAEPENEDEELFTAESET
jgi:hypothetical protein